VKKFDQIFNNNVYLPDVKIAILKICFNNQVHRKVHIHSISLCEMV